MATVGDAAKIISAVSSDLYFDGSPSEVREFKGMVNSDFSKALKEAKPKPLSSFKMTYDASTAQLEPIYYWILDFMQNMGIKVEKITDNFMSSPGSGHFFDMEQRATRFQEEGMKIMGGINQVTKSILQLVYDLKEFEMRISHYADSKSEDKQIKEAGMLALKQIWLDNVDLKRGRGSIHQMSYEMGFTTLREAFLIANSLQDVENLAKKEGILNEQVKRVLIPRVSEFLKWKDLSEKEIKKRFEIEKAYLNSQVETLKLYTKWAMPYLKAAEQLRQKGFETSPALVNAFSTTMFDLVLFGQSKFNFKKSVSAGMLPKGFADYNLKRDYFSCFLVGFTFRGHVNQKVTQKGDYAFGFGGRVDMTFYSYSLNSQEIDLFKKKLLDEELEMSVKFLNETTEISLEQLKDDIDHFLGKKEEQKKAQEKKSDDLNPFSALLGLFKFSEKKQEKEVIENSKDIKPDNYVESYVRKLAAEDSKTRLYAIYDIYKKAHGMASTPESFDN